MVDALIMTLGFEPGPLVSAVASAAAEGLSEGARIIVFTAGFPDERSERAWLELQRILGMMELTKKLGVKLERYEVPLDDFAEAVASICGLLEPLRDKAVRISITGGMRALGLAVFTAYLLVEWTREIKLAVYLEGRGAALVLPEIHRVLGLRISETQLEILKQMRPGVSYTTTDLSGYVGKERSTVYKNLKALADMGLVEREGMHFRITTLGELISGARSRRAVDF